MRYVNRIFASTIYDYPHGWNWSTYWVTTCVFSVNFNHTQKKYFYSKIFFASLWIHHEIIKFCTRIPYLFYYKFQSSYLYKLFFWYVCRPCARSLCREGMLRHRFYWFLLTLLMNILLEITVNHEHYRLNCLDLAIRNDCFKFQVQWG
jgi:hypothetical protein